MHIICYFVSFVGCFVTLLKNQCLVNVTWAFESVCIY